MPAIKHLLSHLWRVAAALVFAAGAHAQSSDLLNTGPRGLTEVPSFQTPASAAQTGQAPTGAPAPTQFPPGPLPPDPATALKPVVFGSQVFSGRFGSETFSGFNADYVVAAGDRLTIRMWGAFVYENTQTVDAQGNVFVPNVGPVKVLGTRNGDLNEFVTAQIKRVFRNNVGVYASLQASQPVKVFVTGYVRAPGLYSGLSSDSPLHYLDRAGGIDPDRGSFLSVDIMRSGQLRATVDLYRFLLEGRIDAVQLQDGDTIVARPRQHTVLVRGEVLNPYLFEFRQPRIAAEELMKMARPRPAATHLSVVRSHGAERRSEYHALGTADMVELADGDEVEVTSDRYPGTILVRIEGAHRGDRTLVLPYGSRLKDALARIQPAAQARMEAVQLFRRSVAARQKELIENSLRSFETYALTARSSTSEEAALRGREAQQILEFIDRARKIQPRGQVVLAQGSDASDTLLQDGDLLQIPEVSNLVLVNGEVTLPNAVVFDRNAGVEDYIARAGGYTQGADRSRLVVVHQDGTVDSGSAAKLQPGDEIMVLPRIETKNIEVTRGVTQILYQIAVAAKVLLNL